MLGARSWMLDARCWMLHFDRLSVTDAGSWKLEVASYGLTVNTRQRPIAHHLDIL